MSWSRVIAISSFLILYGMGYYCLLEHASFENMFVTLSAYSLFITALYAIEITKRPKP